MELFCTQEMERRLPNCPFKLKEAEDKILQNLKDSQLIIEFITAFLN
jgi:hypothetical protein